MSHPLFSISINFNLKVNLYIIYIFLINVTLIVCFKAKPYKRSELHLQSAVTHTAFLSKVSATDSLAYIWKTTTKTRQNDEKQSY